MAYLVNIVSILNIPRVNKRTISLLTAHAHYCPVPGNHAQANYVLLHINLFFEKWHKDCPIEPKPVRTAGNLEHKHAKAAETIFLNCHVQKLLQSRLSQSIKA